MKESLKTTKNMKLKELKKILNRLSNQELEQELLYNSEELSISGVVSEVVKAKTNLYSDGEDDPSRLLTKNQLIEELGLEPDEIEDYSIEIPKGSYYISF